MNSVTCSRPVLRWHGGKWNLATWIIAHFPAHTVYVEPYGGAASVLMQKPRSYGEVYNELDGDVVALFRILRDPVQGMELARQVDLTPFAREEFALASDPAETDMERARRLCVRSYMGFGSDGHNIKRKTGFRANSNRSGTTPAHDWRNYPDALLPIIERLQGVVIENRDACKVMEQHDGPNTLHYVDPPYVLDTRSGLMHSAHVYSHEMTDADHRRMAECLHQLEGHVVLSGYKSGLYAELFHGWKSIHHKALADGAAPRVETLWFNGKAWGAIHDHDSIFKVPGTECPA